MSKAEKDHSGYPEGSLFKEFEQPKPAETVPDEVEAEVSADGGTIFEAPPSARRHIENAQDPRLTMREDTLEHQMGGRFAAQLSTKGVRAVTGNLPGERPVPKAQKPKRPNRWDNVRRYASPKDKDAPSHIAKEIRGE